MLSQRPCTNIYAKNVVDVAINDSQGKMQNHILHFINILRGSGIRVSTGEVVTCMKGLGHIELVRREQFKALLQTTLIKRGEDLEEFERLFDLCFQAFETPDEAMSPPAAKEGLTEPIEAVFEQANGLFSPWFRQLLLQGLPALSAVLPEMGRSAELQEMQYPLQGALFVQRIQRAFGMDRWSEETDHLLSRLEAEGVPTSDRERLDQEIAEGIDRAEEMIRNYVNRQTQALMRRLRSRELPGELWERPFGALTSWEIQAMRQAVRELVKKIRDESSLRQRRRRRGRFDLKQTLRRSLRYGGIPMEVVFRKRRKSKARIVALCDVSSSVWNASRFMLHLLYSLQDQFDKVRSFVFVDQVGEVTQWFERCDAGEAIEKALHNAGIPYNRYTDYGNVLEQFNEEYMDAVNRKTTFIVIGDGRNNYFYPGDQYLARIRDRARRLIWLNPESRSLWNYGDSMMHRYVKQCDEVRECRNLKQLTEFINRLTL